MTWKEKTKKVSGNQIIDSSISFDNLGCTIDEDNMASDSATHVPTQQSVKAYVDANGGGGTSQWTTSGSNIYYNTGNVGIGTDNPQRKLHVQDGDIRIESTFPRLYLTDTDNNSDYSIINNNGNFSIYDDTNTTYRMTIDSSGNVGIGTTSPDSLMHLSANTGATLTLESTDTAITANEVIGEIDFYSNDASGIGAASRGSISLISQDAAGAGSMLFKTSNASTASEERMRIDASGNVGISSGNVGIGTDSPTGDLTIGRNGNASGGNIMLGSATNNTNKYGVITSASYNSSTDTEGFAAIATQGISGTNLVTIGGGIGEVDSATQVRLYTSSASGTRAGTERMRIDSSGNVGIGTTTPSSPLHIHTDDPDFIQEMDSTATASLIQHRFVVDDVTEGELLYNKADEYFLLKTTKELIFSTDNTERIRIDSDGNVGIGITDPAFKLSIATPVIPANSTYQWPLDLSRANDTARGLSFGIASSGTTTAIAAHNADVGIGHTYGDDANGLPQYYETLTVKHTDESVGKVGIGTTSPARALHVNSGNDTIRLQSTGSNTKIEMINTGSTTNEFGFLSNNFFVSPDGTERLRIDASGNVGIGTTSPSSKFVVSDSGGAGLEVIPQTANDRTTLLSYDRNTSTYQTLDLDGSDIHFNISGTEKIRIDSSGNVGIGTTDPQATLHVSAGTDGDATIIIEADTDDSNEDDNPSIGFKQDGGVLESQIGHTSYGSANQNALKIANSVSSGGIEFLTGSTAGASNATSRMFIDTSGNVGIGTVTPTYNLDISGNVAVRDSFPNIFLQETDTTDRNTAIRSSSGVLNIDTANDANTAGTTRLSIDHTTGFVGIGDVTPVTKLHVNSGNDQIAATFHSTDAGSYINITDGSSGTYGAIIGTVADEMVFSPNNVTAMRISAAGKAAIGGAVDATVDLRVHGETTTNRLGVGSNNLADYYNIESHTSDAIHALFKSSSTTASYIYFRDGNSTSDSAAGIGAKGDECSIVANGSERIRIDSSGNVGIGVTNPTVALDVSGTIRATTRLVVGDSGEVTALSLYSGSVAATGTFESNATAAYIVFKDATSSGSNVGIGAVGDECFIMAGGNAKVRIDVNGNFGIGTNDPTEKLDVQGNITATGVAKLDGGLATAPAYTFDGDTNTGMYSPAADTLAFAEGGSETMRINSAGKVLIGTTSQGSYGAKLRVLGGRIEASGYVATGNSSLFLLGGNYGAPTIECRSYTSYSSNTQKIMRFAGSTGTERGSITIAGVTTSFNTSSDERLKENISDAVDAGSKIDAIRIRQFDWKDGGEHQDYGVIAQELQSVAPEAVSEGYDEEDMWSVDYSKLVPTLIKEIQTLRNRVAQLENNE